MNALFSLLSSEGLISRREEIRVVGCLGWVGPSRPSSKDAGWLWEEDALEAKM